MQEPTAVTTVTTSTPLNPFIVTPSPNPAILSPIPIVQTLSPATKRKRPRIQLVNYLDVNDDKPKRQSRRYRALQVF